MRITRRSTSLLGLFVVSGLLSSMVFVAEETLNWVGFWTVHPGILGQVIRGSGIVVLLCAAQFLVPGGQQRKAWEDMCIVGFQAAFSMYIGASLFSYPSIEMAPLNLLLSAVVIGIVVGTVPVCRILTKSLPISARYILAFLLIAMATMGSREAMKPFLLDLDKDDETRISLRVQHGDVCFRTAGESDLVGRSETDAYSYGAWGNASHDTGSAQQPYQFVERNIEI